MQEKSLGYLRSTTKTNKEIKSQIIAVKTSAFFFISKKNLEKIDLLLSIFICSRILKSGTAINIPKY